MASSTTTYLIIDAGGTFLKSAVLDAKGEVFPGSAFSVASASDGSREEILQTFGETLLKGLRYIEQEKMQPGGVGFAFPGPFDMEKATSLMKHKFQSVYGINLREYFYRSGHIPGNVPVRFMHDANAVLAGELWKGNAQGYLNAAVVTLGTGLGFALSENGKVLCNELGGPFISAFKMPYKDGILEDYTSKRGILKIYGELTGNKDPDGIEASDIGLRADHGDYSSITTFKKVGEILAGTLRNILTERKIECLLFSGQISRSFRHMETVLKEELKDVPSLKLISLVKNIDYAALWGALQNLRPDCSTN